MAYQVSKGELFQGDARIWLGEINLKGRITIKWTDFIVHLEGGLFPDFKGWADGYGSFTCSYSDLDNLIAEVNDQQGHHKKMSFEEEYRQLIIESGITIDEKYFP